MQISSEIKVILFSEEKDFEKYLNLEKYENIKIQAKTSKFGELKGLIVLYKNAIILVDENNLKNTEEDVLSYINTRTRGFLLCSNNVINTDNLKKYNNCDYLFKNNLISKTDEFIDNVAKKIINLSKNEKNSTSIPSNSILKEKNETTTNKSSSFGSSEKDEENPFAKLEMYKKFNKVIAIGASTGGTEMVYQILRELPETLDIPIFIVQHMPEMFTKLYAKRMNGGCKITVVEAKDGDPVRGRCAYVAPGGKQMSIVKKSDGYFIKISPANPEFVNNPSVDLMFDSVAENFGKNVVAVILTGMGKDGAKGMLKIKANGGYTIGQDEQSSVVYGMPKVAFEMGAVTKQLPLNEISANIESFLRKN